MNIAKGRMISILDKDGVCFTRVWTVFDMFLTLTFEDGAEENLKEGSLAVYMNHAHTYKEPNNNDVEERNAVGIILGGSTSDLGIFERIFTREASFPFNMIRKILMIKIEESKAVVESDRVHILNALIGRTSERINETPPISHDKYTELNNKFWGSFVSSPVALQNAAKECDDVWYKIIGVFSKGGLRGELHLDFNPDGVFGELSAVRAKQLVIYLPSTIERLIIADAQYGAGFMETLIKRVSQLPSLKELTIEKSSVGGEKEGQKIGLLLVKTLSTNTTIERLSLWDTNFIGQNNVEEWGTALTKNKTLTELNLKGIC